MRKKLSALFLTACMVIGFSACTITVTPDTAETTTTTSTTTTQTEPTTTTKKKSKKSTTITTTKKTTVKKPTTTKSRPTTTVTTKPPHVHNYADATCTAPQVCACGATVGTALGHAFSAATCTSPQICSRCGTTGGAALGHSYSGATCTSPKTCSRCGQTSGSALEHNYVNNKCSRCGKVDPDSLPVELDELHLIDRSFGNSWHKYEYRNNVFTDSFGNAYDGAHCYLGVLNEGQYSTHNLNGQYKNFTGSIVAMPNTSTAGTYCISIYVDGVLKYSKSAFSKTTGKVDFSIDVKGGKTLTIKVCMDSGSGDMNMNVAVVNALLTK